MEPVFRSAQALKQDAERGDDGREHWIKKREQLEEMHKRWNHKQTLSWQRSEQRQRIKKRRADEVKIQIAQVEAAKEQAKIAAETTHP